MIQTIILPVEIHRKFACHYDDVIMAVMASQITSLTFVYSTVYSIVYSSPDQRKHQISAWLAFARGIHRWSVNSPHKWPVTRKMFPFDDVITLHKCPQCWNPSRHFCNKVYHILTPEWLKLPQFLDLLYAFKAVILFVKFTSIIFNNKRYLGLLVFLSLTYFTVHTHPNPSHKSIPKQYHCC